MRTAAEESVSRTTSSPPQVMSPTTTSSHRLMSSSIRSPWPSNGAPKTWTTTTPLSVRRSSTHTEDESITLKEKVCRAVCRRCQWVMIERRNPLSTVTRVTSQVTKFRENSENEQISRTLLDRQREQIFADSQAEIRKHEFQADNDRRSVRNLSEIVESLQEELHRA